MGRVKVAAAARVLRWASGAVAAFAVISSAYAQTAPYIAGMQPDQRPAGAPATTEYAKPADWLAKATHGIEKPHPSSLKFLNDQGAWYTPFTRPGMPGRYDIRHWHQAAGKKAK